MQVRNSDDRYGVVSLLLHWATVVLVVIAWALGQGMDLLPRGAPRDAGLFVHITCGLAVIVLTIVRLGWRWVDPDPRPEPTVLGRLGEIAARLGHVALYGLLLAAPIAGIVTQFARGNAVPLFGLAAIASPWAADRAFARSVTEIHETLSNVLLILAALHAVAAIVHHWLSRDRTLHRMMPHLVSAPTLEASDVRLKRGR